MKNFTKILSLLLALTMLLCFPVAVSAAELEDAPIDESRTGSLTIYKYDLTNAEKDGVWDSSYVSTGVFDQTGVNNVLGGGESALGNGETGYGYAIKGVEFSYVKVADTVTFSESEADSRTDSHVEVLYAIDKTKGADFLNAINLADGAQRYTNADTLDEAKYFYQSDVLIDALAAALESNSTVVKNALEAYISENGGTAMPLTDAYGKTKAENLALGLYLVVETKVPEMVVSTTDPFLVSVPMTSVNGTNATDGGTRWIYDITLYPKNLTGIPSLEKTLRENQNDTGKTDTYTHTGTASAGDTIDYQIISTLPSITSESTYLSCYTFVDTLSKGLTYNKGDVVLEFFTDAACTDSVAKWTEADGKFTVAYNTTDARESVMTIEMSAAGLSEINTSKAVYSGPSMVNSGYSDCTVRITYAAKMDSSKDLVFGDKGNDNKVVLTWKRSSQNYYDTLVDDCHVFSYGIDLTKLFSDGQGDFSKVEFLIQNKTDSYFVKAELNKNDGVYYVVDHVTDKADATHFVPVKTADAQGRIVSGNAQLDIQEKLLAGRIMDYEEKLAAMGQKPEGDLLSELDKFKEATGYEEWLDIDPDQIRTALENSDTAHIDEMLAFAEKAEQAYAAEAEAFVQIPKYIVEQARAVHGEPDTFSIYQLKSGDETLDYRFEPLDSIHRNGLSVKQENYELVYQAPLAAGVSLEDIYTRFNIDHPAAFTGHSLSISDIVVLHENGRDTAHYCDRLGFSQVPEFLNPVREKEATLPTPDALETGEVIRTPRGGFYVTAMSREQMEAAGYGLHHQSDDGKYLIMANGTEAYAIPAEPEKSNPLRTAEMTIEDDYNMIVGVINNGRRGAEQEKAKPSIRERLEDAKRECAERKSSEKGHPGRSTPEHGEL